MLLATKNSKYLRLKNCDSAPIPFRAENNSAVCGTIKPVGVHCSCLGQVFGSNGLMIILIIVNCCSLPAVSQPFNIIFCDLPPQITQNGIWAVFSALCCFGAWNTIVTLRYGTDPCVKSTLLLLCRFSPLWYSNLSPIF